MAALSPSLLLLIALGGALGSLLRYLLAVFLNSAFPYGTLTVNILGCILMGVLSAYFAQRWPEHLPWRLFLTVGCLGGFTTFSSFAADIGRLSEQGEFGLSTLYGLSTLALSLGGFFVAQFFTRWALS